MKEFALKHPWLTFFMFSGAIKGVVSIAKIITCAVTGASVETTVEAPIEIEVTDDKEDTHEPAGDNH